MGWRRAAAAVVIVGAIGAVAPAAGAATLRASLAVTPATGLVDGQEVQVTGSRFRPGATVAMIQCTLDGAGAPDACDPATEFLEVVTPAGELSTPYTVRRVLIFDGDAVDCARPSAQCAVTVFDAQEPAPAVAAPIAFDPDAPVTHPTRADVVVAGVALVRDGGRLVVTGTIACNRPATVFFIVRVSQAPGTTGSGFALAPCGDRAVWRVVVWPELERSFTAGHAVVDARVEPSGGVATTDIRRVSVRTG